ncbi:hypothetical protein LPJ78_003808 [Coemansia sp. RSA 989]|nr:hypothetical protein LPJ78_003808 [Coemansia sp. RSA 989]KAJ1872239.1 hypothetical protein LPJ55_003259 [Coemansia sp. RSA 990]
MSTRANAVDANPNNPPCINAGRRALVVPSHGSAQTPLPLQSPSCLSNPPFSPTQPSPAVLSPVIDLQNDSPSTRTGTLTLKSKFRRPEQSDMTAYTEARANVHADSAVSSSRQQPQLHASSQTVAVDPTKEPPVTLSQSGSATSLLSLYQQTEDQEIETRSVTAVTVTATVADNAGNVRDAGDYAVDAHHANSQPVYTDKTCENNNAADVNNNNASVQNGDSGSSENSEISVSESSNNIPGSIAKNPPPAAKAALVDPPQNTAAYQSKNSASDKEGACAPLRSRRHLSTDNGGRNGAVPSMTDADYVDRFGSYYDYFVIDDEPASKQRSSGGGGNSAASAAKSPQPNFGVAAIPLPPPPLRSTYKSEPMIRARAKGTAVNSISKDQDPRSSYSQMLENALFYSQAIEQIRELDTMGASNPYSAAMPRARPGKENIRQRRARNAIASREMFSITTPSTFIPLPADGLGMMPPPPLPADHPLAMRSEPEFKQFTATASSRPSSKSAKTANSGHSSSKKNNSAVPISRFLPRSNGGSGIPVSSTASLSRTPASPLSATGDSASISMSLAHCESEMGYESERRTGIDQPVPSSSELEEGLKLRRPGSPNTFSSSLCVPQSSRSRTQRHSTSGSEIASTDDGSGSICEKPAADTLQQQQQQQQQQQHGNRHSIASHFSSIAESMRLPVAANGRSHRPHLRKASSHSRKVATRLLMRAGLSRIAIRVAKPGSANKDDVFESSDAIVSSVFDSEAASGVEADPDNLQNLKAERRKQVKHVDEFGFMQFEDDDTHDSEHAQQYEAWQQQAGNKARRPTLDARAASEGKWTALLQSFDAATLRGSRKVKRFVQAGVPQNVRARYYYVLSGATKLARSGEYARLIGLDALPIYDVIERDVARCYPDHVMFADCDGIGQRQLRRILRAYAQYNRAIGYCQGMGRLVGLFLISGLNEEQAFWTLAATISNFIPRYYESDLAGLREHTAVFEVLLHERNPRLAGHLAEQGCDALMYATPWFMTIFTLSLPWPAALRVWDWFMFRGTKVLFRVALGIADMASSYLLDACPTIAELLGFLLHIPPSLVDADTVIAAAARVKISERHVDRLIQRVATTSSSSR